MELVTGMLAILKAGGAYLPLDLSLPAARTTFMLDDAAVDIVLTTSSLQGELDAGQRRVLCLDAPPSPPAVPGAVRAPADPGSLAYVIYTSGSTGTPKGVLVHHRGGGELSLVGHSVLRRRRRLGLAGAFPRRVRSHRH